MGIQQTMRQSRESFTESFPRNGLEIVKAGLCWIGRPVSNRQAKRTLTENKQKRNSPLIIKRHYAR